MVAVYVGIGFVAGCMLTGGMFWLFRKKTDRPVVRPGKNNMDSTVQDIIRLSALSIVPEVSSLIIEYKIHVKHPTFYERYQALNKHERELYLEELVTIFSKGHPEKVRELHEKYPGLSMQDVLLLLMSGQGLDNRTIARIMSLTLETLKKRKTRLNAKIRADLQRGKAEDEF